MNNQELFQKAQIYFPGGINSFSQSFRTVGGNPLFIKSARGAFVTDAENKNYLDLQQSANILGYAHPEILEAVSEDFKNGFFSATPTEKETELAKLIVENIPNIDKVKFFSSESEACLNAVKVARSFTGRDKILKFSGNYHGDSETLLKDSGAGNSLNRSLDSKRVPEQISDLTLVSKFNDIEALEDIFKAHFGEIAAVIIEPVAANMGCIPAETLFLQKIRELCSRDNTILIFDESKTGFRLAFGGAQEIFNIQADIVLYGNIIGGGFLIAAIGGNERIMNQFNPYGDVFAEGISAGNPLAFSAGTALLKYLKKTPDFYKNLNRKAEMLDFGIGKILNEKDIQHRINRKGSMLSLFFHIHKVSDFQDAMDSNFSLYNNFFHFLLEKGIFPPPHPLKSWFVSDAVTENEIERILEIVRSFTYLNE